MSPHITLLERQRSTIAAERGYGVDLSLPLLIAIVGLSHIKGSRIAHHFLTDRSGVAEEPSGETLLTLIIEKFVCQERAQFKLTIKGEALAERIVRRVMANL